MTREELLIKYNGSFIGEILLAASFIDKDRLNQALEKQKTVNKKLGELLVEEKIIDSTELNLALDIQKDLRNIRSAIRLAYGIRKRLGEILLEARKITPAQLEKALKIQEQTGEKLGEILVKLGYLTHSELTLALLFQENSEKPITNSLKLGQILYKSKIITKKQLNEALKIQKENPHKKIGEILLELGYINQSHLEKGLNLQKKLAQAALVGLFSLVQLFNFSILYGAEKGLAQASAKVFVTAHVKGYVKVDKIQKISSIQISHDDIRRGYILIPQAVNLSIKSNYPSVFINVEKVSNGFSESSKVIFENSEIELGSMGGLICLKMPGRTINTHLGFKIELSRDAHPGVYELPFSISVEGI